MRSKSVQSISRRSESIRSHLVSESESKSEYVSESESEDDSDSGPLTRKLVRSHSVLSLRTDLSPNSDKDSTESNKDAKKSLKKSDTPQTGLAQLRKTNN